MLFLLDTVNLHVDQITSSYTNMLPKGPLIFLVVKHLEFSQIQPDSIHSSHSSFFLVVAL